MTPLRTRSLSAMALCGVLTCFPAATAAQQPQQPPAASSSPAWNWMVDGTLFVTFNHQSSERGETQVRSQNWLMAMGSRPVGPGLFSVMGMFSLEPVTVGPRGYSELFQTGEAYKQLENIDRQHPHDLISQLAAAWRLPLGSRFALTISGGPIGEATLGPAAFMHRRSASENPTAPLAHHTLDSTHISQGVVAAAVDAGPLTVEGSAFHGREPDEDRYGITVGALDSWATRVWFRPTPSLSAQVSYGFLHQPEELVPGDIKRTTASVSWTRERAASTVSLTSAVGHNKRRYSDLTAFLVEGLARRGRTYAYSRVELLNVETEHLLFPTVVHTPHPGELIDKLNAYTVGLVRDVAVTRFFELGIGGDVTLYNVPSRIRGFYGNRPVSAHVFAHVRPRGRHIMRMWNMTMSEPTRHGR